MAKRIGSRHGQFISLSRQHHPPRAAAAALWLEICRSDDATEVERSRDTFRARYEAIADGERAAQAWDAKQDLAT